jgi:hypothetical protein
MDRVAQIEVRLLAVMGSWTLPIEPGCEQHLRQFIRGAAVRADREGVRPDSPRILEAEHNLKKLLTEMTRQAGALGFDELHEPTFFNAKNKLCPLWPFC